MVKIEGKLKQAAMFNDGIGRESRRLVKEMEAQKGDQAGAELIYRLLELITQVGFAMINDGRPAPMWVRSLEPLIEKQENIEHELMRHRLESAFRDIRAEERRLMDDFDPKKCSCGSGLEKDAEYDARGIFLTYACGMPGEQKLGSYRSEVLFDPNYWADEAIDED